jgi:hypothetical protein
MVLTLGCSTQMLSVPVTDPLHQPSGKLMRNVAALGFVINPAEASATTGGVAVAASTVSSVSVPIPMTDVIGLVEALSNINNSIANAQQHAVSLPIPMDDVTGLLAAITQINSSIDNLTKTVAAHDAMINSLSATVQNLVSAPTFVDFEIPAGVVDGVNATFVLNAAPSPSSSLVLHRNGMALSPGVDYSLSGRTIIFSPAAVPQSGDLLTASYRR